MSKLGSVSLSPLCTAASQQRGHILTQALPIFGYKAKAGFPMWLFHVLTPVFLFQVVPKLG